MMGVRYFQAVREQENCRFQPTYCNGRGNPAPTLTRSAYGAFATIRGLFIIVKVGARSPRPHIVGVFSDSLKSPDPCSFPIQKKIAKSTYIDYNVI
jgi:hypothetical protein